MDIKTKDLGMERYSDGGICSVGNLLRSLLVPDLRFLITEIGYATATTTVDVRYVRTCPLHCLPPDIYRIENLGTGQVRLDTTVDRSWSRIGWDISVLQFLEPFCNKCIEHYRRVANDADERRAAMETFVRSGYKDLRLK